MELVKPEVPNAQENKGPALFLNALHGGLAAFAQMAQIRRQSESDIARMAFAERQASEEHKFNTAKMAQEYELRDRHLKVEEELMEPRKKELLARADYETNTKGAVARKSAAKLTTMNDFNERAAKYGLYDANPQDPAGYWANARRLKDEFRYTNIPEVKYALSQIDLRTKEHTVPLTINQRIKDDDGNVVSEMRTKDVPIGEILEGLKDPKKYDATMAIIERSGLLDEKASGNKALREAIQAETKRVESGKGTDFSRGQNRVVPGSTLIDSATDPEALPDGTAPPPVDMDESNLFGSIGQTEKYLAQARAALQRGAAPKAVAERLNSFGIDPNTLWAT